MDNANSEKCLVQYWLMQTGENMKSSVGKAVLHSPIPPTLIKFLKQCCILLLILYASIIFIQWSYTDNLSISVFHGKLSKLTETR